MVVDLLGRELVEKLLDFKNALVVELRIPLEVFVRESVFKLHDRLALLAVSIVLEQDRIRFECRFLV